MQAASSARTGVIVSSSSSSSSAACPLCATGQCSHPRPPATFSNLRYVLLNGMLYEKMFLTRICLSNPVVPALGTWDNLRDSNTPFQCEIEIVMMLRNSDAFCIKSCDKGLNVYSDFLPTPRHCGHFIFSVLWATFYISPALRIENSHKPQIITVKLQRWQVLLLPWYRVDLFLLVFGDNDSDTTQRQHSLLGERIASSANHCRFSLCQSRPATSCCPCLRLPRPPHQFTRSRKPWCLKWTNRRD